MKTVTDKCALFVPGTPKNSNASSQWAKYAAAKDRKKFRDAAKDAASKLSDPSKTWGTYTHFVRVTAAQISPVNRTRDPGGLAERLKPILDGIVDSGLLIDDNEDRIELVLAHSIVIKDHEPGILIILEALVDDDNEN